MAFIPTCLGSVLLSQIGLLVGIDVEILGPLDHTFEDVDEAFQALYAHALLLIRRRPELHVVSTLEVIGNQRPLIYILQ